MRDAVLTETAAISARNEALAQLNAQYVNRVDVAASENSHESDKRDVSFDRARPIHPSLTSSTTAFSEESAETWVKPSKPEAVEVPAPPPKSIFKWGSKAHAQTGGSKDHPVLHEVPKPKSRVAHTFQQISVLRVARCDHCGDKMWGSQLRCTGEYRYVISVLALTCLQSSLPCCCSHSLWTTGPPPMFAIKRSRTVC